MRGRRALGASTLALAVLLLAGCSGMPLGPHLDLRGPATLTGRVTDAASGAPVAGATVTVVGAGALQSARTDAGGFYRLQVVWSGNEESGPAARLATHVRAAGFRARALALTLAPGAVRRDFTMLRGE